MAANADDLRVTYAHKLKQTTVLGVGTTGVQTTERLVEGRYFIRIIKAGFNQGSGGIAADIVWLLAVPFVAGGSVTIVNRGLPGEGVAAMYPEFPLDPSFSDGRFVTLHVKKDLNDRIQACCLSGHATLAISLMGE